MKKRAKICFYIFLVCAVFALGILGYFVFKDDNENVMVGSRKFVTFREVPNAVSYSISVKDNPSDEPSVAKYNIEKKTTSDPNINHFEIDVFYETDHPIAKETYTQHILSVDEKNEKMDCIIKDYTVCFFNEEQEEILTRTFIDQTLRGVYSNTLCCVVSEYFEALFVNEGCYQIVWMALDSDGNELEKQEIDFDYYAYYEHDFLRLGEFFINGEWYDYVIDSKDELTKLVWNALLFRQNNVKFYVNTDSITTGNINALVFDAINNYPEYDGLKDSNTFAKMQEKVGKLVNFKYFLDKDFTKTYKDLEAQDSYTYGKAQKYLYQKDTDYDVDYIALEPEVREFEINDDAEDDPEKVKDEIPVNNTEQLFMVVQYGARPVFETDCVAKTVYENALFELGKINNSNLLSDYEKALNIYNYLCMNVVYDYVTYEFMDLKDDFSIYKFGNYNCFYLEGVFLDLDNQYAVCDGIAKAFVLLCRIEGIEAVKVNGEVKFGNSVGNHAWNKVKVVDEEYGVDGWYYVDGTWGVATYSQNIKRWEDGKLVDDKIYYEIPTHTYFLIGTDKNRTVHFETDQTEAAKNHNYFAFQKYEYEDKAGDYFIESDDELKEIFDFAQYDMSSGSKIIEIKISKDYDAQAISLISEFRYLESMREYLDKPAEQELNSLINEWFKEEVGLSNEYQCDYFILEDVFIFRIFPK